MLSSLYNAECLVFMCPHGNKFTVQAAEISTHVTTARGVSTVFDLLAYKRGVYYGHEFSATDRSLCPLTVGVIGTQNISQTTLSFILASEPRVRILSYAV
jgi:hypothetical protein